MAARLRSELGVQVEMLDGPYGQASVLVDGEVIAQTNWTGWLPSSRTIVERVRAKLSS